MGVPDIAARIRHQIKQSILPKLDLLRIKHRSSILECHCIKKHVRCI